MVSSEAAELLRILIAKDMTVYVQRRDGCPVELFDGTDSQIDGYHRAYLGSPSGFAGDLGKVSKNAGKHGWVTFYLPRQTDSVLYMAELGLSTASFDEEGPYDNSDGLRTFARIVRQLRPRLNRPAWMWGINSASAAAPVRDFGFTNGAASEAERGTEWMQWGVNNVRYGPD